MFTKRTRSGQLTQRRRRLPVVLATMASLEQEGRGNPLERIRTVVDEMQQSTDATLRPHVRRLNHLLARAAACQLG